MDTDALKGTIFEEKPEDSSEKFFLLKVSSWNWLCGETGVVVFAEADCPLCRLTAGVMVFGLHNREMMTTKLIRASACKRCGPRQVVGWYGNGKLSEELSHDFWCEVPSYVVISEIGME